MGTLALQQLVHAVSLSAEEALAEARTAGRPVVGYFCHYVPVEVILAAGAVPHRLRAHRSEDSSSADALMSERVCSYVRHVVSRVLDGDLDGLAGAIASNTCDHVRRSADVLRKKTSLGFVGFVSVPRSPRESLYGYYLEEVRNLYHSLGAHLGTAQSLDALRQAIATSNAVRERLRALRPFREGDPPRLTGAESLAVHVAAQILPPASFLEQSETLLDELGARAPLPPPRARVLLVGAELDDPGYVSTMEHEGALVVADRLCFGARSVLEPIDPDTPDPLDALCRAYFFRASCARMIGDFPARWDALCRQLREARADGVIFERLMFCDPWGADQHNMGERAKAAGVPWLTLQREYGIIPTGQLRTRVQAFIERLEVAAQREPRS